jgi:AAA family ATP:ADP antiporter
LEKFLGLFTEVRTGEGITVLLLTLNIFLILTAYYIIKPVREALILASEGAEVKSYTAAGQALLLLVAVPLYARLASSVSRQRLINLVSLFFISCLFVFYGLAHTSLPLGIVFFLWVGIFNLMVPTQFWSFANDLYTPAQGKRLFAIVAFGASSGAVFGSFLTGQLIGILDVYQLLLVGAVVLMAGLGVTNWVELRQRSRVAPSSSSQLAELSTPLKSGGAFRLVFSNRYLITIAFLLLLVNWVNTTGEYLLGRTVAETAAEAVSQGLSGGLTADEYIGKFYSDFFAVVNLAGMLIQLFLVSRIVKYLGVSVAILILPALAFGGYALLAAYPILAVVRWVKTAENSTDYSLQNTVRQMLFLPTTREEKYKAKQAIDTLFWRAGDLLSAALVYVGSALLLWQVSHFAMANMFLVVGWLILGVVIGRHYGRLTESDDSKKEG